MTKKPERTFEIRIRRLEAKRKDLLTRITLYNERSKDLFDTLERQGQKFKFLPPSYDELTGIKLGPPPFQPVRISQLSKQEQQLQRFEAQFETWRNKRLYLEKYSDALYAGRNGRDDLVMLWEAFDFAVEKGLYSGGRLATPHEFLAALESVECFNMSPPPLVPSPNRLSLGTRIRRLEAKRRAFRTRVDLFNQRHHNTHQLASTLAERHGYPGWKPNTYKASPFEPLDAANIDVEELGLILLEVGFEGSRKFDHLQELVFSAFVGEVDREQGMFAAFEFAKKEGFYTGESFPKTGDECEKALYTITGVWSKERYDAALREGLARLRL
ncbi:hypothetical protein BJ508DRAFT_333844 [Ascobolus immersus RN42]|uniref:Uncharacterized protein n=1 Tax=Ascobolus immersus RN42 TaxID=1160509 RepID=A0A3N4HPH1_ASCIM|nr:hypothetical protein BJ508DRAFT_333844 [Ascobolus immersus RN42]